MAVSPWPLLLSGSETVRSRVRSSSILVSRLGAPTRVPQVAEKVRTDPRVRVMERTNLRNLRLADIGGVPVDIVTLDLSFISSTKMLDTVGFRRRVFLILG